MIAPPAGQLGQDTAQGVGGDAGAGAGADSCRWREWADGRAGWLVDGSNARRCTLWIAASSRRKKRAGLVFRRTAGSACLGTWQPPTATAETQQHQHQHEPAGGDPVGQSTAMLSKKMLDKARWCQSYNLRGCLQSTFSPSTDALMQRKGDAGRQACHGLGLGLDLAWGHFSLWGLRLAKIDTSNCGAISNPARGQITWLAFRAWKQACTCQSLW